MTTPFTSLYLRETAEKMRVLRDDFAPPELADALADWLDAEAEAIPDWATHYGAEGVPISEAPAVRVARIYRESVI